MIDWLLLNVVQAVSWCCHSAISTYRTKPVCTIFVHHQQHLTVCSKPGGLCTWLLLLSTYTFHTDRLELARLLKAP